MNWQAMLLAVSVLDALSLTLGLWAALTYGRVLVDWSPGTADRRQIRLEARIEGASLAMRAALGAFIAATALLVVAISLVLPGLVPGAMCGTGVLEAMGGQGERALGLRALAVLVLWVWRTLDALSRSSPTPPDVPMVARWQVLAIPLVGLAALDTFRAAAALDPHQAVSCCQAVYDNFQTPLEASSVGGVAPWVWVSALLVGAVLPLALAGRIWRAPAPPWMHLTLWLGVVAWIPVAAITEIRVLSAYVYEVLHHQCPWCLFLPEHRLVGYPLFGALAVVALGAVDDLASARMGAAQPDLTVAARARQRRATAALSIGLLVFMLLAFVPALWWRLRYGVWMSGS